MQMIAMEIIEDIEMTGSDLTERDPMKIDLVLERIFEFCDVPSLKHCRLVSTNWRNHSLKAWRDKAVIELGGLGKLQFGRFLSLIDSEDEDDNDAVSDSLQLKKYPFRRYSLQYESYSGDSAKNGDAYKMRMRIAAAISNCGAEYVKILCEFSCNFDEFLDEFLPMIITDSLEALEVTFHIVSFDFSRVAREPLNCSNLKRLKLFSYIPLGEAGRSIWNHLLRSFPNLEALSLGFGPEKKSSGQLCGFTSYSSDWLAIARQHLLDPRKSGGETVLPLKEVEMIDANSYKNEYTANEYLTIYALAECKFPLEKLIIDVAWENDGEIRILPLLESCKDTLQHLSVSMAFSNSFLHERRDLAGRELSKYYWKLSKFGKISMKVLKEVRLQNGLEWAMFLLAHLETPKLEKLIVEHDSNKNSHGKGRFGLLSVPFPRGTVYQHLQTFELHDNPTIPCPKTVGQFLKLMPNLSHLTIPLDKSTFPLICENLKGLKILNILSAQSNNYAELDDEALVGMSKAQFAAGDGGNPNRCPNITDLKDLTDLSISCQKQLERFDVKFTEFSVVHGFLQLPKLFFLSVALEGIPDETMEKLINHVKGKVDLQELIPDPDSFVVEVFSEEESSGQEDIENDAD